MKGIFNAKSVVIGLFLLFLAGTLLLLTHIIKEQDKQIQELTIECSE